MNHGLSIRQQALSFSSMNDSLFIRQGRPSCSMYFSTAGVPPTACRSSITYLPLGLRFAKKGVSAAIRRKSCSVRSTPN